MVSMVISDGVASSLLRTATTATEFSSLGKSSSFNSNINLSTPAAQLIEINGYPFNGNVTLFLEDLGLQWTSPNRHIDLPPKLFLVVDLLLVTMATVT